MKNTRGADAEVFALFQGLAESRSNHNLGGIYAGRLRSRQKDVEGIKRKWEELTGVPVPKRLKTDEFHQSKTGKATSPIVPPAASVSSISSTAASATSTASATFNTSELEDGSLDPSTMNYNDIRRELKKRGIPSNGKKIELSERLRHALVLEEDKARREKATKKKEEEPRTGWEQAVVADGAQNSETVKDSTMNKVEVVADSAENKGDSKIDAVKTIVSKQPPAPRSALKPSKYARADLSNAPAVKSSPYVPTSISKPDQTVNGTATSEPPKATMLPSKISSGSDDSSNSNTSKVSAAFKPTTSSTQSTPSLKSTAANGSSIGGSSSAVKLLEKKKAIAETKEARMAKYAEMREKAKMGKAAVGSASKSYSSNSNVGALVSKLKSGIATSAVSSETKPNPIIAKMREKAAAGKSSAQSAPSAPSSQTIKPTAIAAASVTSSSVSSFKQGSPQMKSTQHSAVKTTALKHIIDPANKILSPKRKIEEKPLSPMQTYEMSDRDEESDSEEDSEEEYDDKPKKTIPEWAQRANLNRALEKQFADGLQRMDPDKIFGEVETCNLEEIFGDVKTKKRYHKRTSSGNWTKDHVTIAEKLAYKRTMGYDKM
ncbi:hypothetical protein HJC23_009495 [Cyclotella cryptica]|uniref:SAP domain-containing protein n=1 Tax=Cyclotella cryptica TaxID=29204 RepID=A0ABD3Q5J7_9STRA|eukprot:CCRYP_008810-RA/>CCRYP_008810-RA protein AED:0.03 eAED:0.03 QI:485/1/1/1/1/1/4/626/603